MPETYIPTFRSNRPTNGLQAILPPKWTAPASTTQTQIPSKYAYKPQPTKHVNRFNFFPLTPFVNSIFIDAAKRAFINKIREGCLNEMGCYIP